MWGTNHGVFEKLKNFGYDLNVIFYMVMLFACIDFPSRFGKFLTIICLLFVVYRNIKVCAYIKDFQH